MKEKEVGGVGSKYSKNSLTDTGLYDTIITIILIYFMEQSPS
jgi:hypothetical protein